MESAGGDRKYSVPAFDISRRNRQWRCLGLYFLEGCQIFKSTSDGGGVSFDDLALAVKLPKTGPENIGKLCLIIILF